MQSSHYSSSGFADLEQYQEVFSLRCSEVKPH